MKAIVVILVVFALIALTTADYHHYKIVNGQRIPCK
ncbi:unnamed protein product [Larinioides sclopetarius]|uniref:Uncharacterized protein n=1 Tax=Larinioides sclopetarius TaxID=280406 RepID=A0AAV2A4Q0_9ARAC